MSDFRLSCYDVVGLIHPSIDAHTLGLSAVARTLADCGIRSEIAGHDVCSAAQTPEFPSSRAILKAWLYKHGVTVLGVSYRLDPREGFLWFARLHEVLLKERLLKQSGGPIRGLYFSGLPEGCREIFSRFGQDTRVFQGDETTEETLDLLGIPKNMRPENLTVGRQYDEDRMAFGSALTKSEDHLRIQPPVHDYPEYGTRHDSLEKRLDARGRDPALPLMRAHVGPYRPIREEAVREFLEWCSVLADSKFLDVLSIGTSQLTQERFEQPWEDLPNGGGVPIQCESEYDAVYEATRPMLVRTYAGTRDIVRLAEVHQRSLNIAWHALSFWWFSQIDGRGPLSVRENLEQHFAALSVIQKMGKPLEANVPHHFAFRGADDVTYIVSAVMAARAAKLAGIQTFVLQNMLNTPKATSGVRDLAKARAMLQMVRAEASPTFRVIYQPRAGLAYFSPDIEKAKAQLASATALMDDVEPGNLQSPEVIHVVSFSEGVRLADPCVVNESVQITTAALQKYRAGKLAGNIPAPPEEANQMVCELVADVKTTLLAMERSIPNLYSPQGFYEAMKAGFLPVPDLWECRDEFKNATAFRSQVRQGAALYVDDTGASIEVNERLAMASNNVTKKGEQ